MFKSCLAIEMYLCVRPRVFYANNIVMHSNESTVFQGVDGASIRAVYADTENIVVAAQQEGKRCGNESELHRADVEGRVKKVAKKNKTKDECGSDFPQVVASLFLSPGGPKFIFLMFSFAKYVVLQQIKRDADDDFVFASLNSKPKDLHIAVARNKVAQNRFLQVVQKEDFVLQEYRRKAQLITKQIRDLRSESASLQNHLTKMEEKEEQYQNATEKIQRVRSLWASIMDTMTSLKKEKEVVDSVIKGHVDQYMLDGTDAFLNVPRILVTTIAEEIDLLQIENVFEAGKLNLLSVIQLLNESLKILIQERRQADCNGFKLDLQYIQGKAKFEKEVLSRQKHTRREIRREHLVSVNQSIAEKQRAWDFKWEKELGQSAFHAIKSLNPALDLESSMAHFSFNPAPEDVLKRSVFSQYPPSFSVPSVQTSLKNTVEPRALTPSSALTPSRALTPRAWTPSRRIFAVKQLSSSKPGKNTRRLQEADSCTGTPNRTPFGLRNEDTLKLARQQLAHQVADEVAADSPSSSGSGMTMEALIGIMSSDPFLTKQQIPRTPENLITDIRTSWRKAIEMVDPSDSDERNLHLAASPKELSDEFLSLHTSRFDLEQEANFNLTDTNEPLEEKESLACNFIPCDSLETWPAGGNGPLKGTSRLSEDFVTTRSMHSLTANFKVTDNDLKPSSFSQGNASERTTLSWDSSQWMGIGDGSESQEVIEFGLLQKNTREKNEKTSLNCSTHLETKENTIGQHTLDCSFLDSREHQSEIVPKSKIGIQALRSRLEELKRTMKKTTHEVEDLYKTPSKQFVRQKSASCLSLQCMETRDIFSPTESRLTLDLDYLETSPCRSLEERKRILPRLSTFLKFEEPFISIEHEDLHMLEIQEDEQEGTF
ncbi:HAUS augmin-like complex subunit 6 isoform X2 [Ambystoma mexicanum]|uniref:HAUS augmin-like complex subunit 6 isoform X2 n=1 Tax=Ambystoma mexicanum TaxID=8296 RepID=UPI0037E8E81E